MLLQLRSYRQLIFQLQPNHYHRNKKLLQNNRYKTYDSRTSPHFSGRKCTPNISRCSWSSTGCTRKPWTAPGSRRTPRRRTPTCQSDQKTRHSRTSDSRYRLRLFTIPRAYYTLLSAVPGHLRSEYLRFEFISAKRGLC